jgi:hypothetical protein
MLRWADSNGLRIAGYAVAALASFLAGQRERRRARTNPNLWPTFWFLTGALFLFMAIGRATDLAGWATSLGRDEALTQGWYDHRRKFQALAVGSLGAIWFVTVGLALWRVPERRRRYLPAAVVSFTLMCFAGIRLVSLHQVDSVLYRREIAGSQVGGLLELAGIAVAIAVTFWQPPALNPPGPVRVTQASGNRSLT